ncbi:hypothetical protein [Candidatus Entotheonella palauensis]|uniref:Phytanoyl-CoA dioxygenase n=1 Tax=Candidatus Entotheonella gemina TaxID=1429439 RepID=W4L3D6_9BACT|nr:hypothetical protein [Candidatus Entotheonella palauensis]ETW92552.1 MAG: hypothetical protein ETSY2_53170 [Candidatus Entotheonella gemina]
MSLHPINMIHGSEPNRSATKRIGLSISYCTPGIERAPAPMVRARGRDNYDHPEVLREPPAANREARLDNRAALTR